MAVKAARRQSLASVLAMTPRQIAAYLHFEDLLDLNDEITQLSTARLAQADKKTLEKHLKGILP